MHLVNCLNRHRVKVAPWYIGNLCKHAFLINARKEICYWAENTGTCHIDPRKCKLINVTNIHDQKQHSNTHTHTHTYIQRNHPCQFPWIRSYLGSLKCGSDFCLANVPISFWYSLSRGYCNYLVNTFNFTFLCYFKGN